MKINVLLFSQNVKLDSIKGSIKDDFGQWLIVTSHKLFDYEKNIINGIFENTIFLHFGEILTDKENEMIDKESYDSSIDVRQYYRNIMIRKNRMIYTYIADKYEIKNGYVCCADLGIYRLFWLERGFVQLDLEYYWNKQSASKMESSKFVLSNDDFWVSSYNGKKIIFLGNLSRIAYRMDLEWNHSKKEYEKYISGVYYKKQECQYLTTLHEAGKCEDLFPKTENYDLTVVQDGYLPPNYSSLYLKYKLTCERYYAWDKMSVEIFENSGETASIMPFGKRLQMPFISRKIEVKNILVATSGPGDWTAQKNRSDEDVMLEAFIKIARDNPNINIVYRCHPSWINPAHNGVNSINRVVQCIDYYGLDNIRVSSNLPFEEMEQCILSYSRASFDEDLKKADVVFGEHSISMIDAALKGIPFASVNLSNRRNFFEGINRFGFTYCQSVNDIQMVIDDINNDRYLEKYNRAVCEYNKMINDR